MACCVCVLKPAREYVENNFENGDTFIKREVLARGAYLALAPVGAAAGLGDLALGAISSVGAVFSLGRYKPAVKFGLGNLYVGGVFCLSTPYYMALKVISPHNRCEAYKSIEHRRFVGLSTPLWIKFGEKSHILRESRGTAVSDILKRQVGSRLMCVVGAVAVVAARILETGAGLVFLPVSLVCLGKWHFANSMACVALQAPAVVGQLFFFTMEIINPRALS